METLANPIGRHALRVALCSFLIIMVDGYDTLMISFIAPLLTKEWVLQPTDIGRIFAIGYLGAVIGALAMGPLADRLGRKPTLVAALLFAAATTSLSGSAGSLSAFMTLRFVTGIALGGALPAVIALTAEHASPKRRNGTVTLMYIGYPAGAVLGGAVTAALLHLGWRSIMFGAGGASLLAAAVALTLPDTIRRIRPATPEGSRGAMFTEQFAEGRLWPALMLWVALFCMLMLTYFLLSWIPSIIIERGGTPRLAALGGVLLNLGGVAGALATAPIVNRYGPYRPIAALVAAGAVLVVSLGQDIGPLSLMMVALFACGVCIMGAQLNFPAMTVDLFPPHVRGAGGGWTMGFGRLGSIAGPLIGGALLAAGFDAGALFLAAAVPALVAAAAVFGAARLRRLGQVRGQSML